MTASNFPVNFSAKVTLISGATLEKVKGDIEVKIAEYLLALRKSWEDEDTLIIRKAQIESLILSVNEVIDVANVKINETTINLPVNINYVPVLGSMEVTANE